ncbi:hypothetical protein J4E85_001366 [Alternaria conjuncta]|uniref:uncharacterized protein n=1 Tax=Alternaria conjuncta TaxID=181017 RepID=UPI00221F7862|nr:uncharacterized protein J4E85_001366 [Alternaria conjuncta]KAI4936038.1 hypothetical protein J4E85_001366 [Alternaria conjuncta]
MASILAISKSPVDPSREADDAASEPSVDAEVTQRSFERQRTDRRETMPNERLTIADRTLSSSLPLRTRTGSLIFRSAEQDVEAPLDERTELERQEVPASIHVPGRDEDTDQVGRSPTTAFEADSEPFALHMYQRMAEEPSEEELEPESQSATSVGVNNLEEPAGQFERASTANVTFDPELLALDVYQRIAEEPLEEDSEAESQSAIASTNVNVIEATSSRIQRAPTANLLSNPTSFALRVYQRIADEPLGEEPEPNAIAPTNSNSTEDMTSQIERAPNTQVSRTVEPLEHVKARSPTGTMPPVERRATQTSPGYPANIPRAVTIARDVERKQSSAAPDQLDRALTMRSSPALEPLVYIDPEGLPSKTVPLERVRTQASPELSVDVPRASTIPLESNRRRSSAAQGFMPSARGSEPSVHSSAEAVLDETPQVQGRLRVAPTEPRTTDRRRSSAAPGITASPPQTIPEGIEVGAQTKSPTKKRKQGANYPPEQQYPPAPAYPLRETPSWTKPDTRTPSPKVKAETPPKKRGWLNLGAKPEEGSAELEGIKSRQSSQPALDPSEVQPFLDAAPGSPEAPGGTQKRQNSYPNQTRQATYRRDSSAPPIRRADTRTRQPSVYANKGDYYPVSPILPDRIDNDSQLQPSPSRRNSYSIPQSASIPENSPQDEPRAQYFRRVSSGPSRRQSQSQGALYIQKDVAVSSRAPTFQNKLETEDETSRANQERHEEDFQEPVRKDVRRPTGMGSPTSKAEATPKEGAQSPETRQKFSPVPQKEGPSDEGESDHSPSRFPELSGAQVPRGQEQEPTARTEEQKRTEVVMEEDPAPADAKGAHDEDIPTRRRIDSSSGPFEDDNAWINSTVIEDFQVQTQKKRKSHEQTLVVQPQDECLIPQQPHNLHEKIQQPPREGHRRQSRGRTRDGSHQQSEKTEQRQSSQNYQRYPEHRHDRRRSPQYLDKSVSGEGLPLLEGVQQPPQKLCQTFKPDQQRKAAQDQPRGKSPEVRPRLSRYNQVDGHLLQLEQLTTGEILLPEYNHRKVHWVQPSAQTRSQNNKPSQAHEQNQAMLSQQCRVE